MGCSPEGLLGGGTPTLSEPVSDGDGSGSGGQPLAPSARQEGWSQIHPLVLPKVTNQLSPHLHRYGVSQGVKSVCKCPSRAVSSIQRHVTSGEAAFHTPPPPILHSKRWNFRTKSTFKII